MIFQATDDLKSFTPLFLHSLMRQRLPSLSALRAFEAAARLGSFKHAAEELAVTATAISHRIRVLEEDLERPLFVRKVRAVELTADGRILQAAVSSGFHTMAAAIAQGRDAGRIVMQTILPVGLAATGTENRWSWCGRLAWTLSQRAATFSVFFMKSRPHPASTKFEGE